MAARDEDPITLTVNGERRSRRATLDDCGPDSRVFSLRMSEEGGTVVSFGDGARGKALPRGAQLSLKLGTGTPLPVSLERTPRYQTPDQLLWVVIRNRADGTELELYAPCEETGDGATAAEASERAAARWRLLALVLAVLLLALVLWR